MARTVKTSETPKTIGTQDNDARRIIDAFKQTKGYATHSEAMEKLLTRAERMNLHRMSDEEFEAVVEACVESVHK